jgi:hypothetical protein
MTLRDLGNWFARLWDAVSSGFDVAFTETIWDWPLWISIPVAVGVPWAVIALCANHVKEMLGKRASFWGTAGFGAATAMCLLAGYELWFRNELFPAGTGLVFFMRLGYLIMVGIFAFGFLHGIIHRQGK